MSKVNGWEMNETRCVKNEQGGVLFGLKAWGDVLARMVGPDPGVIPEQCREVASRQLPKRWSTSAGV